MSRTSRIPFADLLRTRLTVIWLLLVAATLLSFESAVGSWLPGAAVGVAVLVIAFVKIRLVGAEFMELKGAPTALMRLFDAWVVIVCGVLIGLYCAGSGS